MILYIYIMDSLSINIGDLVFSIKLSNTSLIETLHNRLSPFVTDKTPDYEIEIKLVNRSEFKITYPNSGDVSKPVIQKQHNNKFTILCGDSVVSVNLNSNKCIITTFNSDPVNIIAIFLHDTIALKLMHDNAIALHSSGILSSRGVFLFSGPSGSGKSTIALNSNNQPVLNDEAIIVRYLDRNVIAFGTPWFGTAEKMANIKEKVKAIFFIKISSELECIKINKPTAYFMLLQGVTIPFGHQEFLASQTALCEAIIRSVPCYRLNFPYSMSGFWENLYDAISNRKELITC